jgi:hypothetical protein
MVRLPSGEDTSIAEIAKAEGNGLLLKTKPLLLERERQCKLFTSENSTAGWQTAYILERNRFG